MYDEYVVNQNQQVNQSGNHVGCCLIAVYSLPHVNLEFFQWIVFLSSLLLLYNPRRGLLFFSFITYIIYYVGLHFSNLRYEKGPYTPLHVWSELGLPFVSTSILLLFGLLILSLCLCVRQDHKQHTFDMLVSHFNFLCLSRNAKMLASRTLKRTLF